VRLIDLLDVPPLGLRRIGGDDEAWARPIRWVYTTDLPDPGRYLAGGELVVTGLMWRRSPADSERFVAAVAAAGAVGLAAGDALFGCVPPDVAEACERHGLPLLGVPEDVSFAAVTEHVAGVLAAARGARLAATVGRQRQLLAAVAEGRGLEEVTARVARETGLVCRVLTATGRHVVAGPSPVPADAVDAVTAAFLGADRFPVSVSGGAGRTVVPVGSALGLRLVSWLVVVEPGPGAGERDVDPDEVVGELAALAALERTMRDEVLRVARPIAEDAVALAASGAGGHPETPVRLRQAGLDPELPVAAVALALSGRGDLGEAPRVLLEDVLAHLGAPVVAAGGDGLATGLVQASDPSFADVLRTALRRLAPGTGRVSVSVGISAPSAVAALAGAVEEARYAQRLASLRQGGVRVVTSDEVTSHVLLLATVPDDVRRTFTARVLGPVLEYDARHDAGLLVTLRVFLDCSGSWSRAATALGLHVNTVRYRIGRVEELTGRDLSRLEDRVDVFLALRSL
jgi:hypothetical protein